MASYTFSCLLLGEHPFASFDINSADTMSKIKLLIIEARSDLQHLTPAVLKLWRVDIILSKDDYRFKLLDSVSDGSFKMGNVVTFSKYQGILGFVYLSIISPLPS